METLRVSDIRTLVGHYENDCQMVMLRTGEYQYIPMQWLVIGIFHGNVGMRVAVFIEATDALPKEVTNAT